jgi:hypothetical protein
MPSGALVLVRAAGGVCELLRLAPHDWSALDLSVHDESWVRLASCPAFPVVSEHVVYGTERVSGDGDPFEGDMEVVRYDMQTSARTQLTFNAIEERFVRLYEGDGFTRIGFGRVPAPRCCAFVLPPCAFFKKSAVVIEPESAAEGAIGPSLRSTRTLHRSLGSSLLGLHFKESRSHRLGRGPRPMFHRQAVLECSGPST